MMLALDLHAERWELVKLGAAIVQPLLVLLLCAGFVLATAHLLTMLGTRWGKRRVSSKTLVFSILLHISLACGIVALWPEAELNRTYAATQEQTRPEKFRVETVNDPFVQPEPEKTGETPVWEQLPDTIQPPVQRTTSEVQPETEAPLMRPDPLAVATVPTPQTTPLPAPEADVPTPVARTDTGPADPAAVPLEIADPQAEMRSEVQAPSTARERSPAVSQSLPRTEAMVRPEAGAVDRLSPDPDPSRDLTSVSGPQEEMATLQRADEAAEVMRREGPAPSTLMVDDAGAGAEEPAPPGASSAPLNPQVARQRTRTPQSVNESGVERFRPATVPQNPDQARDEPVQSLLATTTGEQPAMERPELDLPTTGDTSRVPAPYRMRTQEQREMATRQFGGTPESEKAVELSLKWLAANQTAAGFWDADAHGGGSINREVPGPDGKTVQIVVGRYADTGITGLAVLAFLGAGQTYETGDYTDNVERALRWLISQQGRDGSLVGGAGDNDGVYCHGMATFALAEAYAMRSSDQAGDWLKLPVQRALQYTLDTRAQDGGWRYQKGQPDGDMSIFGWQLMSLKSAELGGITVPSDVRQDLIEFLIDRSVGPNKGLAGYRLGDQPTPAMTAEALFCKQMLGLTRENPASKEAITFLKRYPPHRSQMNYYYWYYGTLAMFQYGGAEWDQWNTALRDLLVADQRQNGPLAGSWDPRDAWGPYGGRVYSTAVATLCLEVYYRYLPLYRLGERFEPEP